MLYHPATPSAAYRYPKNMPRGYRSPKEYLLEFEDCWIMTKDKVKLHAWFIKARGDYKNCRTLIYFHGNAGNVGARLPNLEILVKQLDLNVLILAYRGYGDSEGSPSENGFRLDAEATLDYVLNRDDINKDKIIVFGISLGGAVAIQLCAHHGDKISGLILENTFTSIADMVDHMLPYIAWAKKLIQRLFYPSDERI